MSLVNNSANNFKDFLDAIKPFLNYQFYDMSGQGVEANNFSTDEKVIGTWIDGKPLYQKTYTVTVPNTGSDTQVQNIADLNADKIIDYKQMAIHADTSGFRNESRIDIKENVTGLSNQIQRVSVWISSGYIYVRNSASYFVGDDLYITLRYTKTTDTAVASGEKIVGQWIDGKPVFEKTWSFGSKVSISNANWTDTPISSSGIERIIYACGYNLGTTNDKGFYPLNAMNENSYVQCLSCRDGSNAPCAYITLRYTKTTD